MNTPGRRARARDADAARAWTQVYGRVAAAAGAPGPAAPAAATPGPAVSAHDAPGVRAVAAAPPRPAMNILHVAAEAYPLVKTGGLADVAAALPQAQRQGGADARLLLPGYPAVLEGLEGLAPVCHIGPAFGAGRVELLAGRMPASGLPAYVVHSPFHYRRPGGPYQDAAGIEWPDNLARFALLGWVAAQLALSDLDPAWRPAVVHAHDWHAGLACAYLDAHPARQAATVFTVHNLAFQGRFELGAFAQLGLPARYLETEGLEYFQTLSFMKAGLRLADRITTVSPRYAAEITTPEFGCGLDGVIRDRGAALSGILNGIDTQTWNPAADPNLAAPFDARDLSGKAACKRALQALLGLEQEAGALLICMVSRLSDQKGLDLVLGALPALLQAGAQLAVQGAGDPAIEQALHAAARAHPGRVAVRIAYDEPLAHQFIAGADAILVPSRFEPCGLTQLYGLRYATLPIVRRVGGLADTVDDAGDATHPLPASTGFQFGPADAGALAQAIQRAAARFRDPPAWRQMMAAAVARDDSWAAAARAYMGVYEAALAASNATPAPR